MSGANIFFEKMQDKKDKQSIAAYRRVDILYESVVHYAEPNSIAQKFGLNHTTIKSIIDPFKK